MDDIVKSQRMIDPVKLKLLVALQETGTVNAAASHLHISTSAASQQLASLSREAGAAVTEADGRRLRLTDVGRVLVAHAYQLFEQLERLHSDVEATAEGDLGDVNVGTFPSMIPSLLIPAALAVMEQRPRLQVNIREVDSPGCLAELASGTLDIIVGVEADPVPVSDDPRVERIRLGTEDIDLAHSDGHEAGGKGPVQLGSFEHVDWVSTIEGDACDQLLHRTCAVAGFTPNVRHRASDWTAILALVQVGLGAALVPRAAQLSIPEGVAVRPIGGLEVRRHIFAAVRRGTANRPAVTSCLNALTDAVRVV